MNILIFIPLAGAFFAFLWPHEKTRPWLLPLTILPHTAVACFAATLPGTPGVHDWLNYDAPAASLLPGLSLLFLVCAAYAQPYLRQSTHKNRIFVTAFLLVIALTSLALQASHLGLLWVATEAITLVCVPLIHQGPTPKAYEATWKYLLVSGVGVAMSLLGTLCLGYASLHAGGSGDMSLNYLYQEATTLSKPWVAVGWVFLFVGYGTKLGLVPMHSWKPDTYGESPGITGALLAGVVSTVAFLAILRVRKIIDQSGLTVTTPTLLIFGMLSLTIAGLFLLRSQDFKRMLAYSSMEHMGLLCVAATFGQAGLWAAFFHIWSNALTKGSLFLSAANLHRGFWSTSITEVHGTRWTMPRSSRLLIIGMFASCACPPFGPFFSEIQILQAGLIQGQFLPLGIILFCLLLAFLGLSRVVFTVVDTPHPHPATALQKHNDSLPFIYAPCMLLILSLVLGLSGPPLLGDLWTRAAFELTRFP